MAREKYDVNVVSKTSQIGQSIVISAVFYVLLLTVFVVYLHTSKARYEAEIAKRQTIYCYDCCSNAQFTEECSGCDLSTAVCSRVAHKSRSHGMYTEQEIIEIAEQESGRMDKWKREVGRKLSDPETFDATMADLDKVVVTSQRPAVRFTCRGEPERIGNSSFVLKQWRTREGEETAFSHKFDFNQTTGLLRVEKAGRYSIHLHTTFTKEIPSSSQGLVTHLVVTHLAGHDAMQNVIKASKYVANGLEASRDTLDSSTVYELSSGQTLQVRVEMPEHFEVSTKDCSTFWGVTMV